MTRARNVADLGNGVGTADIDDSAVTTAKIAAGAVVTADIADGAVTTAKLAASGSPSSSTYLRGDQTWATVSGGVTSVATGNGLQGGTITSTGTLSVACPSFNTVGSYVFGAFAGGEFTPASGSNYSTNVRSTWLGYIGCGTLASGLTNNLSGTWKWMGGTVPGGWGTPTAIFCRVA